MDVYQESTGFFPDPWDFQKQIFKRVTATSLSVTYCTDLIVRGVSDQYTWLANIPGSAQINPLPLLFDKIFGRKPAFLGMLEALRETKRGAAL